MRDRLILAILVASCILVPGAAQAGLFERDASERGGFTFRLEPWSANRVDVGLRDAALGSDLDLDPQSEGALAFGFGAFLNPEWALSFEQRFVVLDARELLSAIGLEPNADVEFQHSTSGLTVEWWRWDPVALRAGVHLAFFDSELALVDRRGGNEVLGVDTGFGFEIGAALPLFTYRSSALELAVTVGRAFVDDADVTLFAFGVAYRLY